MSLPVVDVVPYVTDILAWAVPMIVIFFVAKWGIGLVFGKRR